MIISMNQRHNSKNSSLRNTNRNMMLLNSSHMKSGRRFNKLVSNIDYLHKSQRLNISSCSSSEVIQSKTEKNKLKKKTSCQQKKGNILSQNEKSQSLNLKVKLQDKKCLFLSITGLRQISRQEKSNYMRSCINQIYLVNIIQKIGCFWIQLLMQTTHKCTILILRHHKLNIFKMTIILVF